MQPLGFNPAGGETATILRGSASGDSSRGIEDQNQVQRNSRSRNRWPIETKTSDPTKAQGASGCPRSRSTRNRNTAWGRAALQATRATASRRRRSDDQNARPRESRNPCGRGGGSQPQRPLAARRRRGREAPQRATACGIETNHAASRCDSDVNPNHRGYTEK